MISILVVIVAGYLLAKKVKPVWLGVAGCVAAGIIVGVGSVLIMIQSYSGILPIDRSRTLNAAFESSVKFAIIAIAFYAMERFMLRRAARLGTTSAADSIDVKKCPFCAEVVKAEAIVCKHCGRDIAPPAAASPRRAEQAATEVNSHATGASEPSTELTPAAFMDLYGITFANDQYVFQEYRYDKLDDAINYAKHVAKRKQF